MYSLRDYESAKAELHDVQTRWENYTGNNPEKYQADLRTARSKLRAIESYLKDIGELPLTEREKLERELDKTFPNARSNEVVEHEGKKWRRKFFPLEKSRSRKTVTEWGRSWEELKD